MSELDTWVTEYEGRVCGEPTYHVYCCIRSDGFDPELFFLGANVTVDEATYCVCGIDNAECGDGAWYLVYAHYVPQETGSKDWNELYGDSELVSAG
jgi:hypothetical protein